MDSETDKQKMLQQVRGEAAEEEKESSEEIAAYFIFGVLLAIVISFAVILGLQKAKDSKIATLNQEIEEQVTAPLKSLQKEQKQIEDIKKQLDTLTLALGSREKCYQIFNDVALNLYKKTRLSDLQVKKDEITIKGTTDNLDDATKTIIALKKMKSAKDVELTSVSLNADTEKVDYTATIKIDLSLYKESAQKSSAQGASTSAPSTTNATTSGSGEAGI